VGNSHEVWRTLCWSRVQGVGLLLLVIDDPIPVVMVYRFVESLLMVNFLVLEKVWAVFGMVMAVYGL